ncbi:hypothetical protein AAVH_39066 [Aphelenchoides avenae]|nr:hypothetical protein AAVH_39066 [Aphelenchus avenae]
MLRLNTGLSFAKVVQASSQRALTVSAQNRKEGNVLDQAKDAAKKAADKLSDLGHATLEKTRDVGASVADKTRDIGASVADKTRDIGASVADKTRDIGASVADKASETFGGDKKMPERDINDSEERQHEEAVRDMCRDLTDGRAGRAGEYELRDIAAKNAAKAKRDTRRI